MFAAEIQEASLSLFGQLALQAITAKAISPASVTQTVLCTFLVQRGCQPPQVWGLLPAASLTPFRAYTVCGNFCVLVKD